MEKEVKITNAKQAQELSESASTKNYDNALLNIKSQAEMGFTECVLFQRVSFDGVKKLMDNGFSVSEFLHPFEQRKLQKVSW